MSQMMHFDTKTALGWGNRGSLDIINLILLVCMNGTMKTHIMYKCNLNSKQVQEYLELLLRYKFLVKKEFPKSKRAVYVTTERGKKFANAYAELSATFELSPEERDTTKQTTA